MGNAQIIYSNAFNGGAVNIHGTVPTVANGFAGGAGFAMWNDVLGPNNTGAMLANGANSTSLGDSWLLPFAPQPGYVYTLAASLTFTGSPGSWVGLGFAEYDPVNLFTGSRYADNFVTGYDHMILTESSGNVQYFSGPRGNSPALYNANNTFTANTPQTISLQVILNTTGSLWSIAGYVNGVQMGSTFTYTNNPSIGAVGVTQTGLGAPANYRWNNLSLTAVGAGPTSNTINATVSFSPTNTGLPLNPAFGGLSYEKLSITNETYFTSNDVALVHLFSQIGPGVVRIGGGTVDTTGWNGISNTIPITAAYVDRFAGFIKVLPTNWSVIYGINFHSNTPANCAAEASYVANALGSRLYGFEIGNEPEYYYSPWSYSTFITNYRSLAAAITNNVPGWAVTNSGIGWTFDEADAGQGQLAAITDPFASDESGKVSLLTQHYYVAAGGLPSDTMQLLLQQPDLTMRNLVTNIVGAAKGHCSLGARITETASYSAGGVQGVSDVYGAALWSLDYMFSAALNGLQGVNFHGGWISPYSPIIDNGIGVQRVGPEFYGLKMLSLIPQGNVVPAIVTLSSNINFTAYGVRRGGGISAVLDNKDTSNTVAVSVNLGPDVTGAQMIELTGPSLFSSSCYTLGGAPINAADGTWNGGVQAVLLATNGLLTVFVPPISAILLNPVVTEGTNLLLADDALNTSSWTSTNWTDGWPPHAGANYFTSTHLLRTPTSGPVVTFAGDSLTLNPAVPVKASLSLKLNAPGGTYIINNCTIAGGIIDAGVSNATNFLSGTNWVVTAPGGFGLGNDNTRSIVLTNFCLSGTAALSNGVAVIGDGMGTIVYAGDATHFAGPLITTAGTTLLAYSQTNLGGAPASFNAAQFVLDNGSFAPLASLTLSNANSGVTINSGGGTFIVGSGLVLTITEPIAGAGGLTNQGGGRLAFTGVNSYTGPTTINASTLALTGGASLSNTPAIALVGGASFDVSGLNTTFALGSGQTLSNSAVRAIIYGTNNTGSGILSLWYDGVNPALTINNGGMTLSGSTVFKVNNTGTPLALGNSYKLIRRAGSGGPGLVAGTPPVTALVGGNGAMGAGALEIVGGELYLVVLPGTATNLTYDVSGSLLTLSWPTNYTGWLLQSNSTGLLNTNDWFPVPGSGNTNRVQITIQPGQDNVFYRLALP